MSEAIDSFAAPERRQEILDQALRYAGLEAIPEAGPAVVAFLEGPLRASTEEALGGDLALMVVEQLRPIAMMASHPPRPQSVPAPEHAAEGDKPSSLPPPLELDLEFAEAGPSSSPPPLELYDTGELHFDDQGDFVGSPPSNPKSGLEIELDEDGEDDFEIILEVDSAPPAALTAASPGLADEPDISSVLDAAESRSAPPRAAPPIAVFRTPTQEEEPPPEATERADIAPPDQRRPTASEHDLQVEALDASASPPGSEPPLTLDSLDPPPTESSFQDDSEKPALDPGLQTSPGRAPELDAVAEAAATDGPFPVLDPTSPPFELSEPELGLPELAFDDDGAPPSIAPPLANASESIPGLVLDEDLLARRQTIETAHELEQPSAELPNDGRPDALDLEALPSLEEPASFTTSTSDGTRDLSHQPSSEHTHGTDEAADPGEPELGLPELAFEADGVAPSIAPAPPGVGDSMPGLVLDEDVLARRQTIPPGRNETAQKEMLRAEAPPPPSEPRPNVVVPKPKARSKPAPDAVRRSRPQRRPKRSHTEPAPESLPLIILATEDPRRVSNLQGALAGRATVQPVSDALAILDELESELQPVVVIDCRRPAVQVETLIAMAPEMPPSSQIVLWGDVEPRLAAVRSELPDGWVACGANADADDVAAVCGVLLG